MKKLMKKAALILVCVTVLGLLGGCGREFDASGYLKAILDNSYKHDASALVKMGIATQEEAEALYKEGLDTQVEAFAAASNFTQEQAEGFRDSFADILAGVKYSVGEAEKQADNSYLVTVNYQKMNLYVSMMENCAEEVEKMLAQWETESAGAEGYPSEEEINQRVCDLMKISIDKSMRDITYGETESTTVRIELVGDLYAPNDSDLYRLEYLFTDMDELLKAVQE